MKIRSAVPENGCLIVLVDGKKTKTKTKNNCKTYTHPLLPEGGWVNKSKNVGSAWGPVSGSKKLYYNYSLLKTV